MTGYSRDMQRYVGSYAGYAGCRRNQGFGGFFDWLGKIFAPGVTAAEQMAKDIQAAEAAKAAAEQAAAQEPTEDMKARLAAAEAALEQLRLQQRSTEVIRPPAEVPPTAAAGVNWLALGAVGVGAYLLFGRKPARRRRSRRSGRRRRRR